MNSVSLVGALAAEPVVWDDQRGGVECWMRLAVPRRALGGAREPGVVYVAVATVGPPARECADRLSTGSRIGVTGRLDWDPAHAPEDCLASAQVVLLDQLDFLDQPR